VRILNDYFSKPKIVFTFLLAIIPLLLVQCNCHDCPNCPNKQEITLLDEPFDTLSNWTYAVDSNPGALFNVNNSFLSVANFGTQQSQFYGPIATKSLSDSIDGDCFDLRAYLKSNDGDMSKRGEIHITLTDADNVPIVGIYWYHYYSNLNNSYLGLYYEGEKVGMHGEQTISGIVTLSCSRGHLNLNYNGLDLDTMTINMPRIPTKVRVEILKWGNLAARDMQIDWIKVTKSYCQ
jgi:hypothetical protein